MEYSGNKFEAEVANEFILLLLRMHDQRWRRRLISSMTLVDKYGLVLSLHQKACQCTIQVESVLKLGFTAQMEAIIGRVIIGCAKITLV